MEDLKNIRVKVASLLRYYREAANLTIAEVGRLVGKSDRTVSAWEKGRGQPDAEMFLKLCEIYKVESVNVFFGQKPYSDVSDIEYNFLLSFRKLNDEGQTKALSYTIDLVASGNYVKSDFNDDQEAATSYDFLIDESTAVVPLLGYTAAGEPLGYPDPIYDEYIPVQKVPKGAEFALTVTGDSMEPLIKNGSIVFVRPQKVAENGEIVVVEIDGAVTCKKFSNQDGDIIFKSINPNHLPITDFKNAKIIGRVIF